MNKFLVLSVVTPLSTMIGIVYAETQEEAKKKTQQNLQHLYKVSYSESEIFVYVIDDLEDGWFYYF